jgi:hypothetical protein
MSNSHHSVTTCTRTGSTTLTLHLHDYLTPSLNTILSSHWSHLHKHKKKAKLALISALREPAQNSKISITSLAEPNHLPINSDTLASYLTTIPQPSMPHSTKKNAATAKKKTPKSK